MTTVSVTHSRVAPHEIAALRDFSASQPAEQYRELASVGIGFDPTYLRRSCDYVAAAQDSAAMDAWPANPAQITTPSVVTPIQFLQNWLPGFVKALMAARKIDELVGIDTVGNWKDEWIIQGILEPQGNIAVYKDSTNVPLSDWNVNWNQRTVVRLESGLLVGRLEQARAAAAMVNSDAEKRAASALILEVWRNLIGFYGFNSGANLTYGLLNDPGLSSYTTVAAGAAGLTWAVKTYLEIQQDLITAFNQLQVQSQDNVDPAKVATTLAIPFNVAQYLSKQNELGTQSVREWLKKDYPLCRIVTNVQFASANGGSNVFYLWADKVEDSGTDDERTIIQVVPAKFMALGVEQRAKAYVEDFTNATAGIMVKRPFGVVRYTGI